MNQQERLDYLVEEFKADSAKYKELQTPNSMEDKRRILRSLMNIRMPKELSSEVMKVQDEYLTERAAEKGVVNLSDIPVIRDGLSIWQGDITRLSVDAIVNAANSQMLETISRWEREGKVRGKIAFPSKERFREFKRLAEEKGVDFLESC